MRISKWLELFQKGEKVCVFVGCGRAMIMLDVGGNRYRNITKDIPNGRKLAKKAVEACGGEFISGWYPPTREILTQVKKMLVKKQIF